MWLQNETSGSQPGRTSLPGVREGGCCLSRASWLWGSWFRKSGQSPQVEHYLPLFGVQKRAAPQQLFLLAVSPKGVRSQHCHESSSPIPLWRCQQGSLPELSPTVHPSALYLTPRWGETVSQDSVTPGSLPLVCLVLTLALTMKTLLHHVLARRHPVCLSQPSVL